jgi:hypothetical protein
MPSRKLVSYGIIALAGLGAPFGMQVEDGRLRLAQACSQSAACVVNYYHVCSTSYGDYPGYSCSGGCGS